MLKTLNIFDTPDLLHALASMGYGDEIASVDCHFPSVSVTRRVVRMDGASLPDVVAACLNLMPLDTFVPHPVLRMMQVHALEEIPEVQRLCQKEMAQAKTTIQRCSASRAKSSTNAPARLTRSSQVTSALTAAFC